MARRPNYGAEKRQKELKRQQKREDKAEKRQQKRDVAAGRAEQREEAGVPSTPDPTGDDVRLSPPDASDHSG